MKKLKLILPMMAFIFAIGLSFAFMGDTGSGAWINYNGVPTELELDPCQGNGNDCKVVFEDDPNQTEHTVYTDDTLSQTRKSNNPEPYIIP
ncbi:DUF6520 family protein [Arenibacter palladensis]|uniref:DUF6520 family protein n=1 Tax=Arenibacter palladensis TaxID=237373 RepID=UPI0026E2A059|nr:DUF6520 family protein [Arenibacter palladensis]MDO6602104.1 DUF6520 family protein [Arenibacter palladensis]